MGAQHSISEMCGCQCIGFGGSNFHVALKEYQGPNKAKLFRNWGFELLVWSADSTEALQSKLEAFMGDRGDKPLTQLAKQTAEQVHTGHHRLAVVATSLEDLEQKLTLASSKLKDGDFTTPDGVFYRTALEGKVAFLFPGQGAQHLDMGAELVMAHPVARNAWDAQAHLKYDGTALHEVVFPIPTLTLKECTGASQKADPNRMGAARHWFGVIGHTGHVQSAGAEARCGGRAQLR